MKMNQDLKGSQEGMRERPEPDLEDAACVGRAVPESHRRSVEKGWMVGLHFGDLQVLKPREAQARPLE